MQEELKKIGLSEREAKVYLAALELGKASIQDVAKKAGINRTTTYLMIDSLMKKGLVYTIKSGKRTLFAADSPEHLLQILEKKKDVISSQMKEIEELMPQLKSVYNLSPAKPVIRFFEGRGVSEMINADILESGTREILDIYDADFLRELISEHESKEFYKKRVAAGIKYRGLYTRTLGPFKSDLELAEERYISKKLFPLYSAILIYGNRIGMSSLRGNIIGVIIESEEIANTMKSVFELAWQGAASGAEGKAGEKSDGEEDELAEE